jgi:glycosyltransferase involved in cell wall biosynthesis
VSANAWRRGPWREAPPRDQRGRAHLHIADDSSAERVRAERRPDAFRRPLGPIHEIKGLDKLARAYAAALGEGRDADLVLAGPEDGFGAKVRRVAEALGVMMRVHFAGAVYGTRKFSTLAGCVAFVHGPNYEGFGMTVVEAMARRGAGWVRTALSWQTISAQVMQAYA